MPKSAQLQRLNRRMAAIPKAVREAIAPSLIASGNELAGTMRQVAPKDTGALAESIAVTPPGQATPAYSQPGGSRVADELEVLVTAGNADVRYPHLVEYGTADAPAQPFFWFSYRLHKGKITRRTKRSISKAVRQAWSQ
jgi:hypothetical protein